jgi:hypothetical protein
MKLGGITSRVQKVLLRAIFSVLIQFSGILHVYVLMQQLKEPGMMMMMIIIIIINIYLFPWNLNRPGTICNRPSRPVGLLNVKYPTLSRQ